MSMCLLSEWKKPCQRGRFGANLKAPTLSTSPISLQEVLAVGRVLALHLPSSPGKHRPEANFRLVAPVCVRYGCQSIETGSQQWSFDGNSTTSGRAVERATRTKKAMLMPTVNSCPPSSTPTSGKTKQNAHSTNSSNPLPSLLPQVRHIKRATCIGHRL
jgi:hypothetical protein